MSRTIYKLKHISEPLLTFAYDQKLSDPRDGLMLYGPYTHKKVAGSYTIGIIGPIESRDRLKNYLNNLSKPINDEIKSVARPFYPGLNAAFGISINPNSIVEIDIPNSEISKYLKFTDGHQRVHNLSNLYVHRLVEYQKMEEVPINLWFVAIPDLVFSYSRPKSKIPFDETNINVGLPKYQRQGQALLFEEMEKLRAAYSYEINFHNQIKAKLLQSKIVTQIIRDSTIGYRELWENDFRINVEKKFDSAKAWNISTTMYYKLGGLPWKLGDVRPRVCYIGLVYKKVHQSENDRQACCAAQMFLDSGDGVVFKGNMGPWYNPDTKECHLRKKDAEELVNNSLEAFRRRSGLNVFPDEVFVHARTRFDDDEWSGFMSAAHERTSLIGVWIRPDSGLKAYRKGNYAIPRGSVLLSDDVAFLWTKGYIPQLRTQLGLEIPNPIKVKIDKGNGNLIAICKDLLALTKLNYNSCIYADGLPVTLRFADQIGEILTAGENVESGILPFKHYI